MARPLGQASRLPFGIKDFHVAFNIFAGAADNGVAEIEEFGVRISRADFANFPRRIVVACRRDIDFLNAVSDAIFEIVFG